MAATQYPEGLAGHLEDLGAMDEAVDDGVGDHRSPKASPHLEKGGFIFTTIQRPSQREATSADSFTFRPGMAIPALLKRRETQETWDPSV